MLELRDLPLARVLELVPAVLRGARRGDGRTRASSSSPATTTTASPSRCWKRSRSAAAALGLEHRGLPAGEAGDADRRLARRGRAQHRLPGRLAARRRLRHPRPLHGLPHDPAAPGVHRRGGGRCARGGRPPEPGDARRLRARPAPDLRLRLRPRRGRPARSKRDPALRARLALDLRPRRAATAPARRRRRPPSAPASRPASGRSTGSLRADFDADLSAAAITRSGIAAATEMARRLRIDGGPRDHRPHPPRRPRRERRRVAAAPAAAASTTPAAGSSPTPSTTPARRPAPTGRGRSPGSRTRGRRGACACSTERTRDELASAVQRTAEPARATRR